MAFWQILKSGSKAAKTCFLVSALMSATLLASKAAALEPNFDTETPVNFTADNLIHDDENQIVTATGDVELTNGLQIIRAQKIVYNLAEDKVMAEGEVSFLDKSGNVFFSNSLELKSDMKEGFVNGLLAMLSDGSRITAVKTERIHDGKVLKMAGATYTVCKVCEENPHPVWQIKAEKVRYDQEAKSVEYKNARFEFLGVPVIYTPYLAHPDPTIKRKSGLMRPEYGWSDSLGTNFSAGYYYTISQSADITMNVKPTAKAGTLLMGEYRQRLENGEITLDLSTVKSDRLEESGVVDTNRQRGHINATGRFDIDELWRGGFNLARSSDKQYLRLYDISSEDILNNEAYVERFSGRDYSKISLMNFQDLRLGDRETQPDVLPMAKTSFMGEPGEMMGGRWKVDSSVVSLSRDDEEQDVQRFDLLSEWERKDISSIGVVNTFRLSGRGDLYAVQESDAAKLNPALDAENEEARGIATATLISRYPLIRSLGGSTRMVLEPMAGLSLSPKINDAHVADNIPNEDSIDVRFDSSNLFDDNRYPGVDRQEDGGKFSYGVRTSLYEDEGKYGKLFIGQSYRLYGDENVYPDGSGFEESLSDFVGLLQVKFNRNLDGDYRYQFDNTNFRAKRHEAQLRGGSDDLRLKAHYIYVDAVAGTGITEAREQIYLENLYHINPRWRVGSSGLFDIGDEPGMRNAAVGIMYTDECFSLSFKGKRNLSNDASGENDTSFIFRIGLKSIGDNGNGDFFLGDDK